MRQEATREARLKFMKEARLMRRYEHKHVVRILGVAVHEHPLMIIMENCPGLSLYKRLFSNFTTVIFSMNYNSIMCVTRQIYFIGFPLTKYFTIGGHVMRRH